MGKRRIFRLIAVLPVLQEFEPGGEVNPLVPGVRQSRIRRDDGASATGDSERRDHREGDGAERHVHAYPRLMSTAHEAGRSRPSIALVPGMLLTWRI